MKYLKTLGAIALVALMGLEGFEATPYKDIAGVWTDGYGNTEQVVPGRPVTREQAEVRLQDHVDRKANEIDRLLRVAATPGQSDAYQLLAYNIGTSAFAGSSVLRLHNQGRFREACDAILLWNKAKVKGVLRVVRGLQLRRERERAMCMIGLP